eukprot:2598551-Pleurochrysis_carterae.AAC.1
MRQFGFAQWVSYLARPSRERAPGCSIPRVLAPSHRDANVPSLLVLTSASVCVRLHLHARLLDFAHRWSRHSARPGSCRFAEPPSPSLAQAKIAHTISAPDRSRRCRARQN